MRRILLQIVLIHISIFGHGQIIADHRAVEDFENIPASYIAEVKKMMVAFPGESHSAAYRTGMELLEALDATYACNVSTAEAYTDQYVRVEDYGWIGESTWFTWFAYDEGSRPWPTEVMIKNLIKNYDTDGHPIHALGFGWCYDLVMGEGHESEDIDPVYDVHWYGASAGGPDGNTGWGLDTEDYAITGNRVSLESYFGAMEEYIAHCQTNDYDTKMVFTTGTVDFEGEWWGEGAWQGHIKHEAIRGYVQADATKILFDYADILCYDDDRTLTTQTWNGHTFPSITATNELPRTNGHISDAGAIRLAKAQWWMLARMAGWDGTIGGEDITSPSVPEGVATSTVSETSVSLTWSASTDDVGVTGYNIYRSGSLVGSTLELFYTDNTIDTCGSYTYSVSAFDAAENESAQSAGLDINTCPPVDDTPPSVPGGVTITSVSETSVSLTWSASTDDVGVTGYNIYRSGSLVGSTPELFYTDSTIVTCGSYTYSVSAFDVADNESAQSTALQVNTCSYRDTTISVEYSLVGQLSIYPNPAKDHFMVDIGNKYGRYTLEIIASSGVKVVQKMIQLNDSPLPLNLEGFPSGIYYIRIFNDERSYSGKQVILR